MFKNGLFFIVLMANVAFSQNELSLIPKPSSMQIAKGSFVITKETVIQADKKTFEANYLKAQIKEITGLDLPILTVTNANSKIALSFVVESIVSTENVNTCTCPNQTKILTWDGRND